MMGYMSYGVVNDGRFSVAVGIFRRSQNCFACKKCVCLGEERTLACVNGAEFALNLPHLAHIEADYLRGVPIAAFDVRSDEDDEDNRSHTKKVLVRVQSLIHYAK